ncbi:MAG: hypothetical protein IJI41_14095 [Anaerolineaceae bacterium]|nr:hypothetical protein [Anaerolineaceae bacterium]
MIKGYAETSYKGRSIRFGFMPDFNEWVSLCDEGIFEGSTREDVVDQAKKAIDDRVKEAAAVREVFLSIRNAPPSDTAELDRLVAEVRKKIKEEEEEEK